MSNQKDHDAKHRRNDNLLKNLPTEVLLKARSTLVSLGGALKPRHEQQQQQSKTLKPESKNKKSYDRLKSSRSEPEFSEIRSSKHRSRFDDVVPREYRAGPRQRPLSVGAGKRYNDDINYHGASFSREMSPLRRQLDSSDEVCVQSRLVIPVNERLQNLDVHMLDINERPRKKLSFREPEIVSNGNGTLGRSNKLMGVNSLTRRPNKISLRSDIHSSLDGLDSDLESQAMRIVRTVGQAFEVCHKMQTNTPEQPAPSTSSAVDDPSPADRLSEVKAAKEPSSECGVSESGAASTTKVVVEEASQVGSKESVRPKHLNILPPPPRKEGKRAQQQTSVPSINLPDLPECVTKVEISSAPEDDTSTPLSAQHQLKLLRERLDQQAQQTQAAVAQLLLLRDQLAAEQAARCEAQARTHQLLVHNKELLEHIAALVAHLQEREKGTARPISAQQLTLLPQKIEAAGDANKTENFINNNGYQQQLDNAALLNFLAQNSKPTQNQNIENNNVRLSTFNLSPTAPDGNINGSAPCFAGMTNEQIQNYLIAKFQNMTFVNGHVDNTANNNQHFFQNNNAFPNIPPITNNFSNSDLASLLNHQLYKDTSGSSDEAGALAQAMSVGQSQNSLYSNSQATTSKDSSPDAFSSDEGQPFIMPLSHNATLAATGNDGRVRLIVPVSPSESTSDVLEEQKTPKTPSVSLKVPGDLSPAAPITRTTSEKVPNRSELMTALRAQWTRHTTK